MNRLCIVLATLCLVCFFLVGVPLWATEDPVFDHPHTQENHPDLERALEQMSQYPVLRGHFEQEKEILRLGRSLFSRGEFLFSQDLGILWSVTSPFPSETVLLEDRIIQRSPDGRSQILDGSENPLFLSFSTAMLAVFSGRLETLDKHFRVFYHETTEGSVVGLVPEDSLVSSVVGSLVLVGGETLQRMTMTESTGDRINYRFDITQSGETLSPEEVARFAP